MLRQVMMPSKENSTVSIPAEFYGMVVEVLVYPNHKVWKGLTPSMKKRKRRFIHTSAMECRVLSVELF